MLTAHRSRPDARARPSSRASLLIGGGGLCIALAASLSACAPAPPAGSLGDVWPRTRAAFDAASSVRVTATWTEGSRVAEVVSLEGRRDGASAGTVTTPDGVTEVVQVDGVTYLRGQGRTGVDAALRHVPEDLWYPLPDDGGDVASVDSLLDGLAESLPSDEDLRSSTAMPTETVLDGRPARLFDDVEVDGTTVDLFVDDSDRLLRVVCDGPAASSRAEGLPTTVDLRAWDAVAPVTAPSDVYRRPGL